MLTGLFWASDPLWERGECGAKADHTVMICERARLWN